MGPQNGEPYCPCMMNRLRIIKQNGRWIEPERDLGPVIEPFDINNIDKWVDKKSMPFSKKAPCLDAEHNAPRHLWVPPGETYIHTCPSCGETQVISPPNITFSTDEDAFAAESDEEVKFALKVE